MQGSCTLSPVIWEASSVSALKKIPISNVLMAQICFPFPLNIHWQHSLLLNSFTEEYKDKSPWISFAGYAMASTVGSIRMLENHHWLSDVLAGAGLGILSVRVTYFVYPLVQNLLFKKQAQGLTYQSPSKKKFQEFSLAPASIDGKYGVFLQHAV